MSRGKTDGQVVPEIFIERTRPVDENRTEKSGPREDYPQDSDEVADSF